MTQPALTVESLSKSYRLGQFDAPPSNFREALTRAIQTPWRRFREAGEVKATDQSTFWALRDINFEVQRGDVIGIIGRNGAGKSTLLKILSRIVEPTTGKVRMRGRVASLLEVGTGFHPELTGRENVYLNGSILGMKRSEIARKFDEIVSFAGIEKFIDTPVKRYSSGMYVRLAFAVSAHLEPEILIIDEVLAVGDAEFQAKCMGKLREVSKGHDRTILFVSHNLNAVVQLCNNAILLENGRVTRMDSAINIMRQYASVDNQGDENDLSDHPNRSGGVEAIFRSIALVDSDGRRTSTFMPATPVEVRLGIHTDRVIPHPKLALAVSNWRGERIFTVATYLTPRGLKELPGDGEVVVRFEVPAMAPGRYTIDLSIMDSVAEKFLDEIHMATAFEVAQANYLESTSAHSDVLGTILVRSEWNFEASAHTALMPTPRSVNLGNANHG